MEKRFVITVDKNYQMVIPKEILNQIKFTPQDTFEVILDKEGNILLKKRKRVTIFDLRGTMKYPKDYLLKERASWERN